MKTENEEDKVRAVEQLSKLVLLITVLCLTPTIVRLLTKIIL